jgi:GNAT superfamily N-acetyltransferase
MNGAASQWSIPSSAVLWGNALDLTHRPDAVRIPAARAAAAYLARAAEGGCDVWWTDDLFWLEAWLAAQPNAAYRWAPLRAVHWPDSRQSSSILILTAAGQRQALGTICVRRLWLEGTLDAALRSSFGTHVTREALACESDLADDVADCHIAWACGLWRHDTLRGKRIGRELVAMAAIDAYARWNWTWFLGLRAPQTHDRLGLGPFDRLESGLRPAYTKTLDPAAAARELLLVAARRRHIRQLHAETAGAA